jgi:HK97 family phage major capsid protein
MDEKKLSEMIAAGFDDAMTKKLEPMIGSIAATKAREIVAGLSAERYAFGKDITLLNEKTKMDVCDLARNLVNKNFAIDTKANEALIEEQDNRGGYLVSRDVADAILRIAASVGTIMNQAMKWPMKTDELGIPNYTGSFLTGSYLGVDQAGTIQGLTFGQAVLVAKKWQLAFAVGNDLLADASVNLADWLLAIAGESLANMVDQQGLIGTGLPFVGILGDPNTTAYTMATGQTTFASYKVLDDSSAMIGNLEESILDGAAFYMHRTVWASLRVQKDTAGNFILPFAGLSSPAALSIDPLGGPIKPAGSILGFPVFTNRWMPALSATAISTPFIIFGNMKAMAFGDKGDMRMDQFDSGSFGGKEIALADQKGIVYKHRHALVNALPAGFVVGKTAAS